MDVLDEIARRSAAAVRDEAQRVADTETALRDVTSGVHLTPVSAREAGRSDVRRRWWVTSAAAATIIALVVAGAFALSRRDTDRAELSDAPTAVTDPRFVPSIEEPEVLFETTVGSGAGQLGASDELRPLAPILRDDGRLVLGDPVNSRWLVVEDAEVVETVTYDDSEFVWDATLGADGRLFALVYTWSNKGLVNGRVEYSVFADPTYGFERYPGTFGDCCRRIVYRGSFDARGGPQLVGEDTIAIEDFAGLPHVEIVGDRIEFQYEGGGGGSSSLHGDDPDFATLPNGEIVVAARGASDDDSVTWTTSIIGRTGDGGGYTAGGSFESPPPADNVGKVSITSGGFVTLAREGDTWRVLRYPLPQRSIMTGATSVPSQATATTAASGVTTTVADAGAPLAGTVLYETAIGAGDGQLGLEGCQECDPLAPLAPMVAADGTIVVPDSQNRRWLIVGADGPTAAVPYPDGTLVYDAVLGTDGNVYWVEYDVRDGIRFGAVRFARPDDLSSPSVLNVHGANGEVLSAEDLGPCCRTISYIGSALLAGASGPLASGSEPGRIIIAAEAGDPDLSSNVAPDGTRVTRTDLDEPDSEMSWTIDNPGLVASEPALHPLPDGSVVAIQASPLSQEARILHTVNHLRPDGGVATANLPPGVTTAGPGGHWSVTPDGVTTLVLDEASRTFRIVRYPLPTG